MFVRPVVACANGSASRQKEKVGAERPEFLPESLHTFYIVHSHCFRTQAHRATAAGHIGGLVDLQPPFRYTVQSNGHM